MRKALIVLTLLTAAGCHSPQQGHWEMVEQVNSGCWTVEGIEELSPGEIRITVKSHLDVDVPIEVVINSSAQIKGVFLAQTTALLNVDLPVGATRFHIEIQPRAEGAEQ